MLFSTLSAILLGSILASKGITRAGDGAIATIPGKGIIRVGYRSKRSNDKIF